MAEVCRFDEHAGTCDWIACENPDPSSPSSCPLPWPKADTPIRSQSALELLETHAKALEAENARLRAALKELLDDEWRCTVDWGPRDERQAILERCSALVGPAVETSPVTESQYTSGVRAAWGIVNTLIAKYTELPEGIHIREQRNGMVLACNEIMRLLQTSDAGLAEVNGSAEHG